MQNPVCAAATRSWIPSACRWRTSMRSARGGRATAARLGRPDRCVGRAARRHEGGRRRDAAAGAGAAAGDLRRHGDREADDLRAGPRPAPTTTCLRSARSCATRRPDYRFIVDRVWASSTARRFRSGSRWRQISRIPRSRLRSDRSANGSSGRNRRSTTLRRTTERSSLSCSSPR